MQQMSGTVMAAVPINPVLVLPVRNRAEYEQAKTRIADLMNRTTTKVGATELAVQAQLIELYERQCFPLPMADAIEALEFCMEKMQLSRAALAKLLKIGTGRVSEILNRKRPLSIIMIRRLSEKLQIPADILIRSRDRSTRPAD
jgi:HTH-type transcriptional regulator / antitoxin HigA